MTESAERLYELLYIIDATLPESDIKAIENDVKTIISDNGGTLTKENIWGRRQLAYMIKKKSEGYYVDLEFKAESKVPHELRDYFRTKISVLRFLLMQVPKAKLIQIQRDAEQLEKQKAKAEKERAEAEARAAAAAEAEAKRQAEAAEAETTATESPEAAPAPAEELGPAAEAPAPVEEPKPAAEAPAAEAEPAPEPAGGEDETKTGA